MYVRTELVIVNIIPIHCLADAVFRLIGLSVINRDFRVHHRPSPTKKRSEGASRENGIPPSRMTINGNVTITTGQP